MIEYSGIFAVCHKQTLARLPDVCAQTSPPIDEPYVPAPGCIVAPSIGAAWQASDVPEWPPVEVATMSHFSCEQLGCVSHAPLGLSFNGSLWFRRQLQNGRLLALTQSCQERDPAIRKFQRIVMRRDFVFVDLSKDRCLMLDYFIAPGYQARR
jgi:hypothetical protein